MDSNIILECFTGTLQNDPILRNQSENKLKELSGLKGFLSACLNIIEDESTPIHAKKASAVFFKNRIIRFWTSKDHSIYRIEKDEKTLVKNRIINVLIVSDYNIKQQLIPVLRLLIAIEFDKWDGILEQTGNLLQQHDEETLYTGMLCFSEITRKFKWSDNISRKERLYPIIEQAFPYLLNVGETILSEDINELRAEILKLILKCYKFVTYYDLPEPLRVKEQVLNWCKLHSSVMNLKPPSYILSPNLSEQEKCFFQISKCYKWSIANIYRLFSRYASGAAQLSKKFNYNEFREVFGKEIIPHFISQYLQIIEQFCKNERWLCMTSLYQLIEFLDQCLNDKSTWLIIKPYFETIVSHFIYPTVIPNDRYLEIYEEDPQEYINLVFNQGEETLEGSALVFIQTALYKRPKTCLEPITSFLFNKLTELCNLQEDLEVAKKKEGALRILGAINSNLPKDLMIEPMLSSLVIPNLNSKFDFLKARAIEVVSEFSEVNFNSESLSVIIHGILKSFDTVDCSLPVQFESALAIQAFINNGDFKQVLSNIVLQVMSKLLELSHEIDNDAISAVMQECVENFSEQLQPFGVDLMTKLVSQFMRLAVEINDASQVDIDEFDGNYEDQGDKSMAAIGFLNTMITVLLSFENSVEICMKLEEIFSQVIKYVFVNQLDEFFAEVGELIENSTFLLRTITPIMWSNFELLYQSFEIGAAAMYLEELLPSLQNLLIFGEPNQQQIQQFNKIFEITTSEVGEDVGYNDLLSSFEYAQTFILSLKEQSVPYLSNIIRIVLKNYSIGDKKETRNSFVINCNNVIISSLIYDPNNVLQIITNSGFATKFLSRWFEIISILERVYDLKLSAQGVMTLLTLEFDESTTIQLFKNLLILLKNLPSAIEKLENKRKNFNEAIPVNEWVDDEGDENDPQIIITKEDREKWEDAHTGDNDALDQYKNYLHLEEEKLKNSEFFDDDEYVFEDPLVTTPLDSLNIFQLFKQFINESPKSQTLVSTLNDNDKKFIVDLMTIA
ncbi:unnamed protein product [Candida verbasci]|uniref:Importin N-terminal domain-containing protein n=1 Tax=Candida verbasci TaxID=1227364 RepID=A0A9W4U199_9ASCO|nr:unnamed protein product [Candida verbasci]